MRALRSLPIPPPSPTRRRPHRAGRRPRVLLLAALLTAAGVAGASAQARAAEAAEATGAADPDEAAAADAAAMEEPEKRQGIEEIEITGKQGAQDLQSVAESISSFSDADLLDRGLRNFNDLQYNVPSLFSGGGLTKITLRGVGSEIVGPGIDPGFAVHVNNVFSARETTGLLDYFDIERVDVLRGPQGTLWGRNSTGGAVNIITMKPIQEFDANGDVEYGYFESGANAVRARAMLNVPLTDDTLALRVAGLTHWNDGILSMQSQASDQRVSDASVGTIRASLRWEPREDVTLDLIGSWFRTDDNGPGQKFDGPYFTPTSNTVPQGNLWPGAGPGYDFDGALPNPADPYRGTANEPQRSDSTVWTATFLAAWQADRFRVDSITGFQSTDFFLHRDQDTSSLPISTLDLTDESRQISQEVLINSSWDRPFNYTLGAIYQYDWTPRTQLLFANPQSTAESTSWNLLASILGTSFVDGCPPDCPPPTMGALRPDFIDALTDVQNHVAGVYGTVSLEVVEDLTLSLGGRYSYTYRDWNDQTLAQTYFPLANGVGLQVLQRGLHQTHDWSAGTWKTSAEYRLRKQHMLWTSVGTGSRAGGFNFAEERPFEDEHIFAVEAGSKNVFFDDRLVFNLTGFWYDWKDIQIAGTENSLPITRNAPSAVSYGVEFDWQALPMDALALNGSFGWLEAYYNEDHLSDDQSDQDLDALNPLLRIREVNLNGNRLPRSPRFTVSLGAQYSVDVGRLGTIVPRVDFYYRDEIAFRQYGNPADIAPAYTRTDARLTWISETGRFWGEIYGRNLENEAVRTNQEILASIYRVHYYAAPINGGFRLGYSFQGRGR
jgi:iron complex outermembrane receptor protein